QGELLIDFTSAYSRWSNGGDYMGLTADTDGNFYPFWADSRTGTFQINTAAVRVVKDEAAPAVADQHPMDLTDQVQVLFDPSKYDGDSKVIVIPVHVKNISNRTIYPPIQLEVASIGGGFEWEDVEQIKKNIPEILNSSNGKKAEGAVFDFSSALGSENALEPGSISGAVYWRMKVVDPNTVPKLRLKITGSVSDKK